MPPKAKASSKSKEADPKTAKKADPELPPPTTPSERTIYRYYQTNPLEHRRETSGGLHALSPAERTTHVHAAFIPRVAAKDVFLNNKADREFWRQVNRESLPARRLGLRQKEHRWGTDKLGRDVGKLPLEQFEERYLKKARLSALEALHRRFLQRRELEAAGLGSPDPEGQGQDDDGGGGETGREKEVREERERRRTMAALKSELYGEKMGPYSTDPDWDDVVPIPSEEPEGALAAIAYPDDYAEVISYLRAVMAAEEYSPRALRLTEHVIDMNPAHYTVWLYRFKIVQALGIPVADELAWLNGVSLAHLKNYQIWHHRQLLMDHLYPGDAATAPDADSAEVKRLARTEAEFLKAMLAEDTKNYHVWSYRQYLVRKLGLFGSPQELASTQSLIEDDVRNNSAWSHRFFLVFSDPAQSTAGVGATEHDPAVPAQAVDREIRYAEEKAAVAPQNQSPWNYLRGVLAKGGRKLADEEEFAGQFAKDVGDEEKEEVTSSHAMDFLADVAVEKEEGDRAKLYLDRLADKWDPIRAGYWRYRKQQIS